MEVQNQGRDSDAELLRNCLDGGPGAWEDFVSRFAPSLAAVCRRMLQRSGRPSGLQETEDLLQDVFLHMLKDNLQALRDYAGRSSPEAYLRAVAACRVLDDRLLKPRPGNQGEAPLASLASGCLEPAEALEAREVRELLRTEMDRLPARSRLALSLQARAASLEEIGGALGITEDAAAQILSRARALLRDRMKGKS